MADQKKEKSKVNVRDLKPNKDAKGGGGGALRASGGGTLRSSGGGTLRASGTGTNRNQ
jgi:hypothetical protein